jgi:hypothetical protein
VATDSMGTTDVETRQFEVQAPEEEVKKYYLKKKRDTPCCST